MAVEIVLCYRFGPFSLEVETHRLLREEQEILLRPKAFATLVYLLQHAGLLVSKEELLQAAWAGTIVTEGTLSHCIEEVRAALQDSARSPCFVKTIPRLGFKFLAPVDVVVLPAAMPLLPDETDRPVSPPKEAPAQKAADSVGHQAAFPAEISALITQAVKSALATTHRYSAGSFRSPNLRAHEAYLKGRYFCDQRKRRGFHLALECFRAAVHLDADYALAWAGLAHCYNMLANYDFVSPHEAAPLAREHALRALQLDNHQPEAHATLGFTAMFFEYNWDLAETELLRAMDLDHNYAEAYHWHALLLAMTGRMEEAVVQINKAKSLDPVSLIIRTNEGWLHYLKRHDEMAEEIYQSVLQLDAEFLSTRVKYGWLLLRQKKFAKAKHLFALVAEQHPADPNARALLCLSHALAGEARKARPILRKLEAGTREHYISYYLLTVICLALEDMESALRWLERAVAEHSGWLAWSRVDPFLDPVRSRPDFSQILAAIGKKTRIDT